MSIVIKVENLGKQYRLGKVGTGTLSHDINRAWYRLRGKEDPYLIIGDANDRYAKGESDLVWALKDINFDLSQGEVLGIIGKNGAGKSTLLKILSQVTVPTIGNIKMKGRLASLLEVGTGFHPELTGTENIYLNGAILGMRKAEIKSKFDEIVDFSGIGRYIDTPVKRYSSGMYVRLAFAVAAHLEPEILIIDEVLAVGDAEFQRKCLGKMKEVSHQGRTVLFVSHNMAAVKSLCSRGLVLSNGTVSYKGDVDQAITSYLKVAGVAGFTEYKKFENENVISDPDVELLSIGIRALEKKYGDPMSMDDDLELIVVYKKKNKACRLDCTIQFKDNSGNYLFSSGTGSSDMESNENKEGIIENTLSLPKNFFNADSFYINLLFVKDQRIVIMQLNDILAFNIINKQLKMGTWMGRNISPLRVNFKWEVRQHAI